jgi:flagella basal body P-ring formation protein FlgA
VIPRNVIYLLLAAFALIVSEQCLADDYLSRAIGDSIMALYDLDTAGTEVEIIKNSLNIAASEYDVLNVSPMTESEPKGSLPFRVKLFKSGQLAGEAQIRARITYYRDVLVTRDRIRRHNTITSDKYRIERRDVTQLTEKPISAPADVAGKWARRSIGKDQILTTGMLELIPVITPGGEVSILYRTPVLKVTALGIAMEPGYRGDIIRVKNSQSRKVIACTVIDEKTVQVASH